MSFINTRLSKAVAYGFTGGPEWSTQIVPMDNGREQRNAQWLYPRHRYSAQFMNLPPALRDEVLAAFHACRGQLHAFRFKDWNDFTAANEPILPTVGTTTPVQLLKTYKFGSESATRLIQAPIAGAVVRRDGAAVAGTLDTATGLFRPDVAWLAGAYTWSGEFDVWVRFDSDFNAFTIGNWQAHTSDIELREVRR
ncbi:DUF2460 domain-containing protein [Lysobacter korlensis]|uniref:DUF2460 domain-containing protein n=1 Tax=Lysobacter korlensis TaxID=553636 RepID=A0ABV6RKM2_9GAMM